MPHALPDIRRLLFTSVLSDCLDSAGLMDQALPAHIRPLDEASVMAGRARTAQFMEVDHHETGSNPYELEIALIDSLAADEIPVFACSNPARIAPWGELLSTAAQVRGGRGAVVDGLVRDIRKIEALNFPVFAAGIKPLDSQGRGIVVDYNVPVECGEVLVNPGDLIFADEDGVIVVPSAVVPQVVELATNKVARENGTRDELLKGGYLRDAFKKYGVL